MENLTEVLIASDLIQIQPTIQGWKELTISIKEGQRILLYKGSSERYTVYGPGEAWIGLAPSGQLRMEVK